MSTYEKERTFEEVIADTNAALDNIIAAAKYWKERCLAAEIVIDTTETDLDDVNNASANVRAYDHWKLLKKQTL